MKTLALLSKRTRRIAAVAALLLLVASAAIGAVASGNLNLGSLAGTAAGSTCTVGASGATYTTIRAAINDTGCATINVAAGTYYEYYISILRPVAIIGAGASSTFVDASRCTGDGYACTVFFIGQPVAVTFNGLTIRKGYNRYGSGGGIQVSADANVTISNSTLVNNQIDSGQGGGLDWEANGGTLTIRNSTFSGNSARSGAGLYLKGGTTAIVNSTFANNQTWGGNGGAIYVAGGTLQVSSSTFASNSATQGGGIYVAAGQVTAKSTIIANNAGGNCGGSLADGGNNLRWPTGDTSCVGGFGDPKLLGLADNGGATQTIALTASSAAVDAGACTNTNGETITTDQRGSARPLGATCDIGAYESIFQANSSLVAYWNLDEGTGAIANDSSGNGRTGTFQNGASFTNAALPALKFADPFALNLIGTSHHYVDAGTSLNLATSSFTVAGWAKRSTTDGKQWIVGYGSASTDKALVFGFRDNDHVTCAFYGDDLDTPSQYLDTNQWHHWACTFDAATRTRTIYRDGVPVASGTSKAAIQGGGAFNIGRVPWNEGYFSGGVDDIRVYNRALSASEIQSLATGNP